MTAGTLQPRQIQLKRAHRDEYCFVSHRLGFAKTFIHPKKDRDEKGMDITIPGLHVLFEEHNLFGHSVGFFNLLTLDVIKSGVYDADEVLDMMLLDEECGSIEEGEAVCEFAQYSLWKQERVMELETKARMKAIRKADEEERRRRRVKGGVDRFIFSDADGNPGPAYDANGNLNDQKAMAMHGGTADPTFGFAPDSEDGDLTPEQQLEVERALRAQQDRAAGTVNGPPVDVPSARAKAPAKKRKAKTKGAGSPKKKKA